MSMTETEQIDDASRWAAVKSRDAASDGQFVFAVRTTGIYCRPSCPARHARRENVLYFATGAAAEGAGFRPCKRCRPQDAGLAERHTALVARACRLIDRARTPLALDRLAAEAGLSPSHFHRLFKRITGVTPKAYERAKSAARAEHELRESGTVTEAVYAAGFSAPSRFYEALPDRIGMTPQAFRRGGAGRAIRYAFGESALGTVLVAATERGLCAILLGDDRAALEDELARRFPRAERRRDDAGFAATVAAVTAFVDAPAGAWDLPLDIAGTAFQQRVWEALRAIPPGRRTTYAEIASAIGAPRAVRAVAQACGANPVAVAIPCHRVVRTDGALSGYRWGVARKKALLDRESGGG